MNGGVVVDFTLYLLDTLGKYPTIHVMPTRLPPHLPSYPPTVSNIYCECVNLM